MRIELLRVENYLAPLFWFRDSFDSTSDVHENPVLTGFFYDQLGPIPPVRSKMKEINVPVLHPPMESGNESEIY